MTGFGVYVHVPYCRALCPYCDFNVAIDRSPAWEGFAGAVRRELETRGPAFAGAAKSLYFGGGTPSLAPPALISRLAGEVRERFGLASGAEITLEADPGTIDATGLSAMAKAGVNRLSIGWQSTHDDVLRTLGRSHTAEQSRQTVDDAQRVGFDVISVDLIFAVPGQTMAHLERDLDAIVALDVSHVSLYALTWHEGTEFFRRLERGQLERVTDAIEVEMFARIEQQLAAAGFEHYEVSNFARPGFRAVHNSSYWTGQPYLGAGPGAHSFARANDRAWRWESVRNSGAYQRVWHEDGRARGVPTPDDGSVQWVEELSDRQQLAERIMTGVRLIDGVDLSFVDDATWQSLSGAVENALARGWIKMSNRHLTPTSAGRLHADALAELFF